VKLFSAVTEKSVRSDQIDTRNGVRIRTRKVDVEGGTDVPPDDRAGKSYSLLVEAMDGVGKVAIARFEMHSAATRAPRMTWTGPSRTVVRLRMRTTPPPWRSAPRRRRRCSGR